MRFTPRNRADWRQWLADHHADEQEVWLVFFKKNSGKANLSYNDAVEEAICFGWIDGLKRSLDDARYMHRFSPRKPDSQWSSSNIARAKRMLASKRMSPAGRATIAVAKKNGRWSAPADAPTGFPMPAELEARLKHNAKAAAFFATLAPSYQRQYIAWIATAKRPDTRKRRLDEAIERLAAGEKPGMR